MCKMIFSRACTALFLSSPPSLNIGISLVFALLTAVHSQKFYGEGELKVHTQRSECGKRIFAEHF